MIQLNVLSGKKAGSLAVVRRFPFRVGRSPASDLVLDDDGVWDEHLTLELQPSGTFGLSAAPDALVAVNGHSAQSSPLRNGDTISFGSVKIQFWLAAARQRSLALRELLTWALLLLVTLTQVALVYWLLGIE